VIDLRSVRSLGFDDADAIGRKIIALHKASEFDVCTLFFSRFKSVISQIPTGAANYSARSAGGRESFAVRRGLRL